MCCLIYKDVYGDISGGINHIFVRIKDKRNNTLKILDTYLIPLLSAGVCLDAGAGGNVNGHKELSHYFIRLWSSSKVLVKWKIFYLQMLRICPQENVYTCTPTFTAAWAGSHSDIWLLGGPV